MQKNQKIKAQNVSSRSKSTKNAKQNKLTSFVGSNNILFLTHFYHFLH